MFDCKMGIQTHSFDYRSLDLFNLVESSIELYKNEDVFYYKPKGIEDWYCDWDFKNYNPNVYSHGFHQYPAKFIPQLVRKLLRVFTDENSTVLDIFMGSGTTLVESILLNRKLAIGIEINPLACFMAKVKTTPINPEILVRDFSLIEKEYYVIKNYTIHNFPNIHFWFKQKQIEDLSKLREIILNIQNKDVRDFFLLCMSEVVRKVSLTKHNEFKLYRDKYKIKENFDPDVFWCFQDVVRRNIYLMSGFYYKTLGSKTEIQIVEGNSVEPQSIKDESVDFIITSPPYGDSRTTVAYGQFSKLSLQWIMSHKNISNLDKNLLGGRITNDDNKKNQILKYSKTLYEQYNQIKFKDAKRAEEVLAFYVDLFDSLLFAYRYLKSAKYFVLVIGNRTVKNVVLRTDLIISELAEKIGFKTEEILYRNIINKRLPPKNSPTNVKGEVSNTMLKESLIFLKKS